MTFEELLKANETIKTTDIKGKNYAEVNQRIKAFRMLFPNGTIVTDILSLENGVCVMKATIRDEGGKVLGTGTAYENEGSTFINKTSYIENCETSAVGRALGMVGIGIDTSVASYEEVSNAIHQQDMMKKASDPKIKTIKSICQKHGIDAEAWVVGNGRTWDTLTEQEATKMLMTLKKKYGDE
jgi:hypothetical protein